MAMHVGTWGTSGTRSGVGSITCPQASYITDLTGRAGDNVFQITGATCRNVATGAITRASGGTMGGVTDGNPISISCAQAQGDGLAGFAHRSETDVEGLSGVCNNASLTSSYRNGQWGNQDYSKHAGIDSVDSFLYQVSGGTSSDHNNVSQMTADGKDFRAMSAIVRDPVAAGACVVGDDSSSACAEIKPYLPATAADTYCAQNNNVVNSQSCVNHYNHDATNPTYRSLMMGYCSAGANWALDTCKNYCTWSSSASTPAKSDCDSLYANVCQNNSSDLCSCLQPWSSFSGSAAIDQIPGAPKNPVCYFSNCIQVGYKPISSVTCPQCVQNLSLPINANTVEIGKITQACGITAPPGTPVTFTPTLAPASAAPVPAVTAAQSTAPIVTSVGSSPSYIWVILSVCLLILVVLMLVLLL